MTFAALRAWPLWCALPLMAGAPATARVVSAGDAMMIVDGETRIAAPPERVWAMLVAPSRWWSARNSLSGDAANLALGERAGGCFCETLPGGGQVEHARVVRIEPGRLLRIVGALGPLQAQPVSGPLTFEIVPDGGRSRVRAHYALAGGSAPPLSAMAPLMDAMLAEQLGRLKAAVERGDAPAAPVSPAKPATKPAPVTASPARPTQRSAPTPARSAVPAPARPATQTSAKPAARTPDKPAVPRPAVPRPAERR